MFRAEVASYWSKDYGFDLVSMVVITGGGFTKVVRLEDVKIPKEEVKYLCEALAAQINRGAELGPMTSEQQQRALVLLRSARREAMTFELHNQVVEFLKSIERGEHESEAPR